MALWELVESLGSGAYWKGVKILGVCPRRGYWGLSYFFSIFLLATIVWRDSQPCNSASLQNNLRLNQPEANTTSGLKPLKLWAKVNFPLTWSFSGILSQWQKADSHKYINPYPFILWKLGDVVRCCQHLLLLLKGSSTLTTSSNVINNSTKGEKWQPYLRLDSNNSQSYRE
jgi:hypothetical protein